MSTPNEYASVNFNVGWDKENDCIITEILGSDHRVLETQTHQIPSLQILRNMSEGNLEWCFPIKDTDTGEIIYELKIPAAVTKELALEILKSIN